MADPDLRSLKKPHFFQPLLPGFESHLNIPITFFSEHVEGRNEKKTVKLRSDVSNRTWEVKLELGRRLTRGWREFITAHDFRVGDVIVFRHEGDFVFHVTALGPSFCEVEYTVAHNSDDDHKENIEIRSMANRAKINTRREEDSSSDNSCFVANVSVSNLKEDKLYVPLTFARSNSWSKTYGKVVLLNDLGRSWKLSLDHDKSGEKTFLRYGWRSFCNANGMRGGRYTFKLVRNLGTPVLRLCKAGHRPKTESSSARSCFVGSLTASSLHKDTLYIPKELVSSNGLKERCCDEIVLKNEYGETWNLKMVHYKPYTSKHNTFISQGWRRFCQVNGLKAGDTFRFKLVRTEEKPVLCLCTAESSQGKDVNFVSTYQSSRKENYETDESEEENPEDKGRDNIICKKEKSIKDKSSLRERSNIQKSKYCSRPGASSLPCQSRFATLTVTPYSFRSNKLRLPLRFTRVNGINKPGKITLLGQDGLKRLVNLVKQDERGQMRLGKDWRGFCEAHGVRIGESFVLELIRKKDGSLILKFCTKSISV